MSFAVFNKYLVSSYKPVWITVGPKQSHLQAKNIVNTFSSEFRRSALSSDQILSISWFLESMIKIVVWGWVGEGVRASIEQVWTGLQWWPPDANNRRSQRGVPSTMWPIPWCMWYYLPALREVKSKDCLW